MEALLIILIFVLSFPWRYDRCVYLNIFSIAMLAVSSLILLLVPYLGVISRDLAIRLLLLFTLLPVISLPRWSLSCSNGTNSFLSVKLESISVDLSKALLLNLEFLNVELASAFYI